MNERLNGRRRPHRGNREGERRKGGEGEAQYADAEDEESLAGVRGYKTGREREGERGTEEGKRKGREREREKKRERAWMGRRER